mmetsp:Transcript_110655/g.357026  ORF Transcript_110655/g.357026 Transcript_110655/m.357026 type:complete len:260 (+) Transcript_110655:126-905(+)
MPRSRRLRVETRPQGNEIGCHRCARRCDPRCVRRYGERHRIQAPRRVRQSRQRHRLQSGHAWSGPRSGFQHLGAVRRTARRCGFLHIRRDVVRPLSGEGQSARGPHRPHLVWHCLARECSAASRDRLPCGARAGDLRCGHCMRFAERHVHHAFGSHLPHDPCHRALHRHWHDIRPSLIHYDPQSLPKEARPPRPPRVFRHHREVAHLPLARLRLSLRILHRSLAFILDERGGTLRTCWDHFLLGCPVPLGSQGLADASA